MMNLIAVGCACFLAGTITGVLFTLFVVVPSRDDSKKMLADLSALEK